MKKYIVNTIYQILSPAAKSAAVVCLCFFSLAQAQKSNETVSSTDRLVNRFSELERTIARGTLRQFQKECSYIENINESKILEIQKSFNPEQKSKLSSEQVECFDQYLGQIVGAHNIYKSLCDEITPQKQRFNDKDLSRLFVNVRKFESGIRPYHEKLNDCLLRRAAPPEVIVDYSDFEHNSRMLSGKIKEMSLDQPFRENRVDFR